MLNSLLGDVFDPFDLRESFGLQRVSLPCEKSGTSVPVDIQQDADGWLVDVLIPGLDKDRISLSREGVDLIISTAASIEDTSKEKRQRITWILQQIPKLSAVKQRVRLSKGADLERVTASYENGILRIRVPVAANAPKVVTQITVT